LQSHANEIHLLPALPSAWKEGRVKGLKARGNLIIDIDWKEQSLLKATVLAKVYGKIYHTIWEQVGKFLSPKK